MRFEDLGYHDKKEALLKLHKRLNKRLFDGKLNTIKIDIVNLDGCCSAMFLPDDLCGYEKMLFDFEYVDKMIPKVKTQALQVLNLAVVLVHEMCHQYIFENGIVDDCEHGIQWQKIAAAHGLQGIYKEDETIEETCNLLISFAVRNFRFEKSQKVSK